MTDIDELHNKILYLEDRLNKINESQQQKQQHQSKKESHIFDKCECPTCHKTFANKYVLKTHIEQRHPKNERTRFECQHCHKAFLSPYYLKYHLERLHPETKKDEN
jgi:hypothetical protein